jgi:hypothetical protein
VNSSRLTEDTGATGFSTQRDYERAARLSS